jgi:hypothetical protein
MVLIKLFENPQLVAQRRALGEQRHFAQVGV